MKLLPLATRTASSLTLLLLLAAAAPAETSSWVFQPSTYTHDPYTGARVAQYQRTPAVEPLEDPRQITSRYRRARTTIRGGDGSVDTTYEVQSYGNDRGGLDAQWERFHDAWRQSLLTGSYYNRTPAYPYGQGYGYPGYGYPGYGPGYGPGHGGGYYPPVYGPGYPDPGYGHPGHGRPGPGGPGHGHPGHGGPGR